MLNRQARERGREGGGFAGRVLVPQPKPSRVARGIYWPKFQFRIHTGGATMKFVSSFANNYIACIMMKPNHIVIRQ